MSYDGYESILVAIDGKVATITFNRPEKRNAMSPTVHIEMTDVLGKLRFDPDVNVIVITGAGSAFCAGMDLKQFFIELNDKPSEFERISRMAVEWRGRTLRLLPKPVIAAINGYCFGGAFGIVEGCDLAIAAEEATFGLSEVNFKLFPGGAVSKAMANQFRPRDALFYGLTGRPFNGVEAARIGLVNYAVPGAQLMDNVMALAREIADKDHLAVRATKMAYRHSLHMDWDAAMDYAFAKEAELSYRQNNAWQAEGIGDFLKGEYRPGLETHGTKKKA